MSSFYINTFFMAEGSTKSRILFKKILFKSCPVMSNSLPSHGLQHQASLSFTSSRNLLKLMSIELAVPSNHLILCCPLLLASVFPSIKVFSSESALCIRWPEQWSFGFFSISLQ